MPIDEFAGRAAAPVLRPWVGGYVGYRQRGLAPARHRGLPSPWLTVIFTLDEPLAISRHPDPRQHGGCFDALVGGLHTRPAVIDHDGAQSGLQVDVHPLGARPLLGVPAGALASLDVEAVDVLGPGTAALLDRLRAAADWSARFALLDGFFAARLVERPAPRTDLVHGVHGLVAGRRVADVADDLGWSPRHLQTVLRRDTGLSPRDLRRVGRFDRARRWAQSDPAAVRWSEIAVGSGYSDQSHLVRDFHEFAGTTPGRWLDEEFRSVQDAVARPVPEWGP